MLSGIAISPTLYCSLNAHLLASALQLSVQASGFIPVFDVVSCHYIVEV